MFLDLSQLGIVACPGGVPFADSLITQLEHLHKIEQKNRVHRLEKDFDLNTEDATQTFETYNSLVNDVRQGDASKHKHPIRIKCAATYFANGEFKAEILESVRNRNIYVVQDVGNHQAVNFDNGGEHVLSVNDHIMNLYVVIDALLQAKPRKISLVLPLYPYARQHKRNGREGLTASSLGRVFENMGVEKIITLDIHSRSTENSFQHMGLENLRASYQIIKKLWQIIDIKNDDLVVLAPDSGSLERNKFYAQALGKPLALLYKERDYAKVSTSASDSNIISTRLLGDVEGKTIFIPDDILGTGGTLINTMKLMKKMGAKRIICAISLGLFDHGAVAHFDKAYEEGYFHRIICTDAVNISDEIRNKEWFLSVSVVKLFAASIANLHLSRSISQLMDNRPLIRTLMQRKSKSEPKQETEDDWEFHIR